MKDDKFLMFQNRLNKVFRHLGKQAKRLGVSCYRLYDHDLPEFPFCIELYEDKLYVAEYKRRHGLDEEEHALWMERSLGMMTELLDIPKEKIFLRLRQRKPGRLGQYQRQDQAGREFVVEENGLKFIVNLSDYLDTGLFLDHRNTRQSVKEQSQGKKVLNLFAYTGSFSVYAASGNADEIVTVDLSKTYLGWAERNMNLNGFSDRDNYKFVHADIKQWLKSIPREYFDLVVMDPPTFSNSKRMEDILDIQRDHPGLINECLDGLKKNGKILFSTNSRKFIPATDKIKAAAIKDITKQSTPFDFEGRLFRHCYEIYK